MTNWNPPRTFPTEIGEYHAVLDPNTASSTMRRLWNGKFWSSPYSILWSIELQEKAKAEPCQFQPAWLSLEDTAQLTIQNQTIKLTLY